MITNVIVEFRYMKAYSYTVKYASGRTRFYKEKNLPKTVENFIRGRRSRVEDYKGSLKLIYE